MDNLAQKHNFILEELVELREIALDNGLTSAAGYLWTIISTEGILGSLLTPEQLRLICVCPGCGGLFERARLEEGGNKGCPTCDYMPTGHSFEAQPERLYNLEEMLKTNDTTRVPVNLGAFLRGIKDAYLGKVK